MITVSADRLAAIFVEAADTLVDDFDLIEFLHMLTERATGLVGAAATGLVMADMRGVWSSWPPPTRTPSCSSCSSCRTRKAPVWKRSPAHSRSSTSTS